MKKTYNLLNKISKKGLKNNSMTQLITPINCFEIGNMILTIIFLFYKYYLRKMSGIQLNLILIKLVKP